MDDEFVINFDDHCTGSITTNFNFEEFASPDGAEMSEDVRFNIVVLARQLQALRDSLGVPVYINSGYRSAMHNKSIGGVYNSYHIFGKAADIRCDNMSPLVIRGKILELINDGRMLVGGVGLYKAHVHYDIRLQYKSWIG